MSKTGYAVPYPYKDVRRFEIPAVYAIPLNEGCGRYIEDSNGSISSVTGTIEWEKDEEPVRKGEYASNTYRPFAFSSAAKIKGQVNFGRISQLNFSSNYSISFWCNEKNRKCHYTEEERYSTNYLEDGVEHIVASFGNLNLIRRNYAYGISPQGSSNIRRLVGSGTQALQCSDNYYFVVIVIANDKLQLSINGRTLAASTSGWDGYKDVLLSNNDFIIGSSGSETFGFISDFKVYNRVLTEDEILNIYKGFNY